MVIMESSALSLSKGIKVLISLDFYLIILMGCATSYQPVSFSGGYSESQLSRDMFDVSFRGNGFTSKDRVRRMLTRRCAELTKNKGFDYFVFLDHENETNYTNLRSDHTGSFSKNHLTGASTYQGQTTTSSVPKYDSRAIIKMFKSGEEPPNALDASIILNQYN